LRNLPSIDFDTSLKDASFSLRSRRQPKALSLPTFLYQFPALLFNDGLAPKELNVYRIRPKSPISSSGATSDTGRSAGAWRQMRCPIYQHPAPPEPKKAIFQGNSPDSHTKNVGNDKSLKPGVEAVAGIPGLCIPEIL
jgi:hypothetical protein